MPYHFPKMRNAHYSLLSLLFLCLILPSASKAQSVGQITCSRPGDFVYLYSSLTTLNVQSTLQCGQQVEVLGRYDNYYGVRTADGVVGYVALDYLLLMKTAPGAKPVLAPAKETPREKVAYDPPSKASTVPSNAKASAQILVLPDSTPVRLKLSKALSSADAKVGDDVELSVSEDVVIDGLLIIPAGALAAGVVNEAEPKKALGRGGKLGVLVRSVHLANDQEIVLRSGGDAKGASSSAGMVIPVMHGKDVTFPKGADFVAYVNGDTRLRRENFHAAPELNDALPSGTVINIPHY